MKIFKFISVLFLLMNSLLSYSQCNTCGGKGYLEQSISCASCNYGYVETVITRDCTHCYGAGRVSETCDECYGSRTNTKKVTRTCSICGGSGYRKVKSSAGQCTACSGTGNSEGKITSWSSGTRCTKCGGEGVIYIEKETYCTCERGRVSRMEQVPCNGCGGTGKKSVICPTCHGQKRHTERMTTPCSVCKGTGSRTVRNPCPTCNGWSR